LIHALFVSAHRREEDVTDDERNTAKVVCLAVIYGMGKHGTPI
jgi:DNA polymerase I-like protein with 3'-5' exonuclease and polymerase domains